ncbi:MAG: mannitol-1-phosphate 5-dehydrogenase [Verrucomicrobia bacterium]|nr:mannitol-1-phosphate 5-dehydrogenase [Prolixibacteraceae bacterium]
MNQKKMVLFGAGKIGRSFIGQLFSRSGYEVVFIDINQQLIENLNKYRRYKIIIKHEDRNEVLDITNIRGIHINEKEKVADELANATIAALSVGQQGLSTVIPLMANALIKRRKQFGECPLDIVIAENMRNSDQYLAAELKHYLPLDYPFEDLVGLVETSIGKMVPMMSQKDLDNDPLQVFAEPYNTLIVSKKGFKNPVPEIIGMEPKENIKAWVDRKLFIHNLGHATIAYLGFQKYPKAIYIYEVLEDAEILDKTRKTMMQSADILRALYPGEFSSNQLEAHIDDLLCRFQNKALGDTIFRVGCDLYRKLSPEDRLVAPINAAIRLNKPFNLIFDVLVAAMSFGATNEKGEKYKGDEKFSKELGKGKNYILRNICKLILDFQG